MQSVEIKRIRHVENQLYFDPEPTRAIRSPKPFGLNLQKNFFFYGLQERAAKYSGDFRPGLFRIKN